MKMKKIICILLVLICSFTFFSCNTDEQKSDVVINETAESTVHYVEGTLHKVSVKDSDVPFVTNGTSGYCIYADQSDTNTKSATKKAALYVSSCVESLTGCSLEVCYSLSNWTKDDHAIVFGFRDVFEGAGLTMPSDNLSTTGYYIKTVGNTCFIEANGSEGYHLGALCFLREVLGYDMISEDCVVYEKTGATLPVMEITEKPDFDYRQIQNYYTSAEVYGMGMQTHSDIWIPVNGWDMHNVLYYIPYSTYGAEHPSWYREDLTQPCYTAHGNKAEYDLMLQAVMETLIERIESNPTLENISITQMDGTGADSCNCETCLEYKKLYGTPVASTIYFMNDINELLRAYLAENDPDRNINLIFFAYHDAETAPVEREIIQNGDGTETFGSAITDENGNYIPLKRYLRDENNNFVKDADGNYIYETDENGNYVYLKCDDKVYPWIAPIYAKYTQSFYAQINKTYADNIKMWYTVSDNVYLWLYGTNFSNYLFPYNSWSTMVETFRYLKNCGVNYIWVEGQENNISTAFTDLKDYIDSKFLFNVNLNYEEVVENYFSKYYLEGASYMKEVFLLEQAQSDYVQTTYSAISGAIYDEICLTKYWPRELMQKMVDLCDEALKAVEKYKKTDAALYNNLRTRILKESIFPRYVICRFYEDYYENIYELRSTFRDYWNEFGFTTIREVKLDLQSVFTDEWGLK